ncbi:PLC-like phosphodiesterase [Pseudoneurospora amorphoporcata]|uniref:PLC-like phosphodiesterase n=1 Tax=Pseudoneurospora amorphoporcata TaxID=241081 RepID=A0AAN6P6Z9_9PEZI|nr:PLC-like phosphodiesterase [Pseudoneurospora amorphoporcata]
MPTWTTPAPLVPNGAAPHGSPILVPFEAEIWCFWVNRDANDATRYNIAYTKTNQTGWDAMSFVDDTVRNPDTGAIESSPSTVKKYDVHPVGKSQQPFIGAAVLGPDLHLVFTAINTANGIPQLRHLKLGTQTGGAWVLLPDTPAQGIAGGLNLISFNAQLALAWLDGNGARMGAIYRGNAQWEMIQMPNESPAVRPGSAMATVTEGSSLHLLTFSPGEYANVIDFVVNFSGQPPQPVVRQESIPMGFSADALSASSFQEFIFWVLHNPATGRFKIMQYSQGRNLKEIIGLDARAATIPAIQVAKNACYCVWLDTTTRTLTYSIKTALIMPVTMNRWMTGLGDDLSINRLTIPGTHDSGAVSRTPYVGCHMTTIQQQLENGIRYFDLRAGYGFLSNKSKPVVHHAVYSIFARKPGTHPLDIRSHFDDLEIEDVFKTFYEFLDKNPGEGLIVQIKRDNFDEDKKVLKDAELMKLANDIWELIQLRPSAWILTNSLPTLGQLRGKIQLVRRFVHGITPDQSQLHETYGIPVAKVWVDKAKDDLIRTSSDFTIRLQDYFDLTSTDGVEPIGAKWALVEQMLNAAWLAGQAGATAVDASTWFINFSSGMSFPRKDFPLGYQAHSVATGFFYGSWSPLADPYGVNGHLLKYFNHPARQKGGHGTIVMDFPEQPVDLIPALVRSNFAD